MLPIILRISYPLSRLFLFWVFILATTLRTGFWPSMYYVAFCEVRNGIVGASASLIGRA